MEKRYVVGVDLGGTKIATGLINLDGQLEQRRIVPTVAKEGVAPVIKRINDSIRGVLQDANVSLAEVAGIGICSPGPLNPETGVIGLAPNLNWKDVPISAFIQDEFGLPTFVENDANAAALGEVWFGAGRGTQNVLYITVSTGVGGGIVINGDIYHGKNFMAGEVGHSIVDPHSQVRCGCGQLGCLETICSGTAIARQVREQLNIGRDSVIRSMVPDLSAVDVRVIAEAAIQGDALANEIMDRAFLYLGTFVINMLNVLDVEKVVIGGGVSKIGERLFSRLRRIVTERMADVPARGTPIVPAETGDNAGILGVAWIVLRSVAAAKPYRSASVVNR